MCLACSGRPAAWASTASKCAPTISRTPPASCPVVQDVAGQLGLLLTYATMATLFTSDSVGVEALRQDIADARTLGAALLRIFPGPVPDSKDDPGWERARAVVAEAARQGVVLALENFGRAPGCTVQEIRRVLERLGPAGLVTNIDIGNYAGAGEDVPAAIRALGDWARAAHLKDQPGGAGRSRRHVPGRRRAAPAGHPGRTGPPAPAAPPLL